METIKSAAHMVTPREFARVAAEQYVQRWWPLYAAVILLGIGLMATRRDSFTVVLGLVLAGYPFIAPIRYASAAAARARAFTSSEMTFEVTDEEVIVRSQAGGVTRGALKSIRRVDKVRDFLFLQFGRATYVVVPLRAFGAQAAEAESAIRSGGLS